MENGKQSLWQIVGVAQQVTRELMESAGEVSEELEQMLATVEKQLRVKSDAYVYVLREMTGRAEELKQRAKEFRDAARVFETAQDRLKDTMKWAMDSMDIRTIHGQDFNVTLSASSKPSVEVVDESLLPGEYWKEVSSLKPDLETIREAIRQGVNVPGVKVDKSLRLTITAGGKK